MYHRSRAAKAAREFFNPSSPENERIRPPGHSLAREVFYMRSICITFRSVTLAQRGERTLRSGGVDCTLQRTPRWMEERGCGYCLRLRPQDAHQGVQLLRMSGVTFSKVLSTPEQGKVEELPL